MKYYKDSILFVLLLIFQNYLYAGGADYLALKSSKALSLNGIYLAGFDGIIGSRFNPSHLSNLNGYGLEFSAADKLGDQSITTQNGDNYTSFRNDDFKFSGGVYAKILDNIAVGISYSPELSFDVDWPYTRLNESETSSIVSAYDLKNMISIKSISPILSFKFGDLSLGIAANIYQGEFEYSYPIENDLWNDNIGLPGYGLIYKLEGWSYGFTLGLLYNFSFDLSLAFALQSSSKMNIEGDLNSEFFKEVHNLPANTDIESQWENPWKISVGGIYRITSDLAINLDFSYNLTGSSTGFVLHSIDNDDIQSIVSNTDSITGLSGEGLNIKFKNALNAGIGLEYVPSDILSYRFGYLYNQSLQDKSMYNHLFPNIDQHWFSAGIGINQSKFVIDIALSYALGIETSINDKSTALKGEYSSQLFMPSLTIKYEF